MKKGTNTIKILLEHPETEHSEEALITYQWFYIPGIPPSGDCPYGEPGGYEYSVNSWNGPKWITEDIILDYLYNTEPRFLTT